MTVVGLTVAEIEEFQDVLKAGGGKLTGASAELIIRVVHVPDDKGGLTRLFRSSDKDKILRMPAKALTKIVALAAQQNGLTDNDLNTLAKN